MYTAFQFVYMCGKDSTTVHLFILLKVPQKNLYALQFTKMNFSVQPLWNLIKLTLHHFLLKITIINH